MRLVRTGQLILILVLFVGFFPISISTPVYLGNALLDLFPGHKMKSLSQFDKPGSGRDEGLPREVNAMLSLLEEHDADSFRLSPGIAANKKFHNRIIESAFPKLVIEASPFLLQFTSEPSPAKCQNLSSQNGVTLARCK